MTWTGSASFSDRFFAYRGAVGPTRLHAHHAVQIIVCFEGAAVVVGDRTDHERSGSAFVVPADAHHAIASGCAHAMALFVEPESETGHALESLVQGATVDDWRDAGRRLLAERTERTDLGDVADLADPLNADLDPEQLAARLLAPYTTGRAPTLHPAIQAAADLLPSLVASGEVRVGDLARRVHLSESRLMHLFREQIGLPLRPYVKWLRLRLAAEHVQRGSNLTEAAHAAGFSDSSHFCNVFREAFGLVPSEAFRTVTWEP